MKVMGERKRRTAELLRKQREAFVKKFGREPGPDDPIVFDPDADSPVALTKDKLRTQMIEVMQAAGSPPHLVFAYAKIGLIAGWHNRECQRPLYPQQVGTVSALVGISPMDADECTAIKFPRNPTSTRSFRDVAF
jgi:hypothetical protein